MHNLALALHGRGYRVTGSDDEIAEPSRSRLLAAGLLPAETGWYTEKILEKPDAVILGMHARSDNPELLAARKTGIPVYSYPEYIYMHARDKKRVVIGGSHGKTTITAMVMHVLRAAGLDFDYLVGSRLEGFETMVRLSDAGVIVLEGDEYLSSAIDPRPKFHWYKPHIALLSGIAWDHVNVFPTFENYVDQFRKYIEGIEPGGMLVYCNSDEQVRKLAAGAKGPQKIAYGIPAHEIIDGNTHVTYGGGKMPLRIFGDHNLMNMEGARLVCAGLGVDEKTFASAIGTFKGAARRLELMASRPGLTVFQDFAHSPSKLSATVAAVKKQFAGRMLTACLELHTFSSLNAGFLRSYRGTMDDAGKAIVYFNPETAAHKRLPPVTAAQVKDAFGRQGLEVFTERAALEQRLSRGPYENDVLLLMTSGTFDGLDLRAFAENLVL